MPSRSLLTIGRLAERANVSTSMLRFYEREGLLKPARRTESGYRLYSEEAEETLLFIRRAQRLGFSLDDIKLVLAGRGRSGRSVVGIAENRFLEIERRLTELLVLRHELELFLNDLTRRVGRSAGGAASRLYRDLLDHVCGHHDGPVEASSVTRLMKRLGCSLAETERERIFTTLRGHHVHVWREGDGYSVLVPGKDESVSAALRQLVAEEAGCSVHVDISLAESAEGLVLTARGDSAFLFAQLFLALEASAT
jgi:MerR family transcriptional regulator, copper efflux regulator